MLVLLGRQVQRLQGFDKTHQHRQGRADFVRDVGHEVAAHGLGLLQRRDVARQQQVPPHPVGVDVHRQHDGPRGRAVAPRHQHRVGEVLVRPVAAEGRIAHQVADRLLDVALGIKAEMALGHAVAPLDVTFGIHQHQPVGAGLQRRQNVLHALLGRSGSLFARAHGAADVGGHHAPDALERRERRQLSGHQPLAQSFDLPVVPEHPQPGGQQSARQGGPGPPQPARRARQHGL